MNQNQMTAVDWLEHIKKGLYEGLSACHKNHTAHTPNMAIAQILTNILNGVDCVMYEIQEGNVK